MNNNKIIMCRCEDITLEQIQTLLVRGFTTFEDLKRQLRVGMGPCQGQTCGELIQREIAKYLHVKTEVIPIHKIRPLTTGVKLKTIKKAFQDEC